MIDSGSARRDEANDMWFSKPWRRFVPEKLLRSPLATKHISLIRLESRTRTRHVRIIGLRCVSRYPFFLLRMRSTAIAQTASCADENADIS